MRTKLKYPIVARSGGHSYEGFGIGDKDCYLVVDLANLNKIIIDVNSQTAVVGPGNRLEPIYNKTSEHMFAFPAGTCPWVGVGGLITGGGFGYLNRKFGMSSDNILDAQIVLANGTVVHSAKKHPEIFWSIQGAGNAGYGIAPLLFSVMNKLGSNIHPNITFLIRIAPEYLSIRGIYIGSANELQNHIQEFVKLSKPKNITYTENTLYHALVDGMEGTEIKGKVNEIGRHGTAFVHRGFLYHMEIKITVNSEISEMCLQEFDNFSQEFRRNYA
ncbi:17126_t:CDS:2 [Gigaspora margarita]|uniref:17126_t:CDS:1 n=1 Tax=Gigaspora margarita TaxID=4874 RepID=A0ABN7VDA4_GIGMA|nr:17126_t:CDS:2 [Gigaspora margarita]